MIYTTLFLIGLCLTAAAMALTVVSGVKRRRRVHLARAISTVVLLAVTVVFAYLMGRYERSLPEREMGIHRIFSMTVAGVLPFVAITGIMLWRDGRWRRLHQICVGVLLIGTVCALATGLWVLSLSEPM
jgi:CDP-diglyceride synthetase